MLNKEYREWLVRSEFADVMSRRAEELYDIADAEPDDDGLIECPLLPLRDMVDVSAYGHARCSSGARNRWPPLHAAQAPPDPAGRHADSTPTWKIPAPDDWYPVGVELAVGRTLRMPDNSTSVLAQGRRRVQIVSSHARSSRTTSPRRAWSMSPPASRARPKP